MESVCNSGILVMVRLIRKLVYGVASEIEWSSIIIIIIIGIHTRVRILLINRWIELNGWWRCACARKRNNCVDLVTQVTDNWALKTRVNTRKKQTEEKRSRTCLVANAIADKKSSQLMVIKIPARNAYCMSRLYDTFNTFTNSHYHHRLLLHLWRVLLPIFSCGKGASHWVLHRMCALPIKINLVCDSIRSECKK